MTLITHYPTYLYRYTCTCFVPCIAPDCIGTGSIGAGLAVPT